MQLHFKFGSEINYSEENFFVAENNIYAFNFATEKIKLNNAYRFFAFIGEKKSGKSHLANILANRVGAKYISIDENSTGRDNIGVLYKELSRFIQKDRYYIIENVENFDEEILFHIINLIENKRAKLLITSQTPLQNIDFKIDDLQSRIRNFIVFNIAKPSRELIKAIIIKNLADKQIILDGQTIEYILPRLQRSYLFIDKFINKLEHMKNTENKKITIFTVKKVLNNTGFQLKHE